MATTPDLTTYNSLVLYDADPTDLVNRAVIDAAAKTPEWVPVDGNWEMVLFEASGLVAAEVVYSINRVPDATITGLLGLFGVSPAPGEQATATLTFTLSDALGHTVPAGTVVEATIGTNPVQFTTDDDAVVAPGDTTATVAITSVDPTAAANGIAGGTVLTLITAVPFIDSVTLASAVTAGADPETDTDFLNRGVQRFARLNDSLVLAPQFVTEVISTYLQVFRATVVDNWNAGTSSSAPGHVTVAVLGSAGATLTSGDKAAIQADLQSKALVNLAVHVIDPTVTNVNVTASLHSVSGQDPAAVHDAVVAALGAYLSTDTWPWAGIVRVNKLLNVIENVAGVDYVDTLTVPSADVTLSGVAPLARLGTATITVTSS